MLRTNRNDSEPPTKRQRVMKQDDLDHLPIEMKQGGLDYLPIELLLVVAKKFADQPNRWKANNDLDAFMSVNKHIRSLILNDNNLNKSVIALRRNPNIQDRHIAVCRDVVNGIPIKDALKQNSPLPEKTDSKDPLYIGDVHYALSDAAPEHLANLAEAFSERTDPMSETALIGISRAVAHRYVPSEANPVPKHLAHLAEAFSARTDPVSETDLTGVTRAVTSDDPKPMNSANLDNLVKIATAITNNHLDLEDYDLWNANEELAMQLVTRGDNLLADANIEHITTLSSVFDGHQEDQFIDPSIFNGAMDRLAFEVTTRSQELLAQASAKQLTCLRQGFGGPEVQCADKGIPFEWPEEPDCPEALAVVVKEMNDREKAQRPPHGTQRRPQLDDRERSIER